MQNYNNLGNVRLGQSVSIDYESSLELVVMSQINADPELIEV